MSSGKCWVEGHGCTLAHGWLRWILIIPNGESVTLSMGILGMTFKQTIWVVRLTPILYRTVDD